MSPVTPWMQVASGQPFDLLKPRADQVRLSDIAHSLARLARFNGHTLGALPWNVAQHSLLVEMLLPMDAGPELRLLALLHDAAEAYTGDVTRPMKEAIRLSLTTAPDPIANITEGIDAVIRQSMALPESLSAEQADAIHAADLQALIIEQQALMELPVRAWNLPAPSHTLSDDYVPTPLPPPQAAEEFLTRAIELFAARHGVEIRPDLSGREVAP